MTTTATKKRHREVARRLLNGFINPLGLDALTALGREPLNRLTAGQRPMPAPAPIRANGRVARRPYEAAYPPSR